MTKRTRYWYLLDRSKRYNRIQKRHIKLKRRCYPEHVPPGLIRSVQHYLGLDGVAGCLRNAYQYFNNDTSWEGVTTQDALDWIGSAQSGLDHILKMLSKHDYDRYVSARHKRKLNKYETWMKDHSWWRFESNIRLRFDKKHPYEVDWEEHHRVGMGAQGR